MGLGQWSGKVGWYHICVCYESGLCMEIAGLGIVLGGYLRILGAPSVQSYCTVLISVF